MTDRLQIFRSILGGFPPGTLLELGAGHGKFSIVARDLGWKVTAVDARTERFPEADGITWIHSDVRDFEIGEYDIVSVLGLFYHLERVDQLKLLDQCAGMLTIIDTHVSLRPLVEDGGYAGRYFSENLSAPTASWKNEMSFWPTEDGLFRMLSRTHPTLLKVLPELSKGRTFYIGSPGRPEDLAPLVRSFNQKSRFRLEIQRPSAAPAGPHGVAHAPTGAAPDAEAAQRDTRGKLREATVRTDAAVSERDRATAELERLRNRKSVKAAVAVANRVGPLVRWVRARLP